MPYSSYPSCLQPHFQTSKPNEPITVFEGDFTIAGEDKIALPYSGSIQWRWLPSPKLVIDAQYKLEDIKQLQATHKAFHSPNPLVQIPGMAPISMRPTQFELGGSMVGTLLGMLKPVDTSDLTEVLFHLPNFPDYYGQPIKAHSRAARAGRLVLQAGMWTVTIDNLSNTKELLESLEENGGFAITHAGTVKRTDSNPFSFEEVDSLMHCLSFFLSFVSGRWTPPILWMGRRAEGDPVLMTMSNPQVASWKPVDSWFNASGQDATTSMSTLFPAFYAKYNESQRLLSLSVSWYFEVASKSLVSDSRIVLTQVALELLTESLPPLLGHKLKGKAEDHLRGLLNLLVPTAPLAVPSTFTHLTAILNVPPANSWNKSGSGVADGPSVVVSIRNKITHAPRSKAEKDLLANTMAMYEASQLGQWYLELVLLGWLGYAGQYRSRLIRTGWVGKGEVFPPLPPVPALPPVPPALI